MIYACTYASTIGPRDRQQDRIHCSTDGSTFAVVDGMGGQGRPEAGDCAAEAAVHALARTPSRLSARELVVAAHEAIVQDSARRKPPTGGGATIAIVRGASFACVGDSFVLAVYPTSARPLALPQNIAAGVAFGMPSGKGLLWRADAEARYRSAELRGARSRLTACIGCSTDGATVREDIASGNIPTGHLVAVVLLTDGAFNVLGTEAIADLVRDPSTVAGDILVAAERVGVNDNATVVLLRPLAD